MSQREVWVLYTNEYLERISLRKKTEEEEEKQPNEKKKKQHDNNNTNRYRRKRDREVNRVHLSLLSLLPEAASFFSLRFRRKDGVRNFDFFSFFTSVAFLFSLVRFGET